MEYNFVVSENTRKLFWKGWGMSMCRYRFGKLDSDLGPDDIIGPKSVFCFRDRKWLELIWISLDTTFIFRFSKFTRISGQLDKYTNTKKTVLL